MHYLYHRVPKDLEGAMLYPLNQLQAILPHVFEKEKEKYRDRVTLLQVKIPFLNCFWNDVLHLTAVAPKKMKQALIEAGRAPDFEMRYFQIDPNILGQANTVVYLYNQMGFEDISEEKNFRQYNPAEIGEYAEVPQKTRDYYKELVSQGKKPLLYHLIPHILYKGSINTKNLEVVTT